MDAISRNDEEGKNHWLGNIRGVILERASVKTSDRESQVSHMKKWNELCNA